MGCGSCGGGDTTRTRSRNVGSTARVLHQVVLKGGEGRGVFQTHDADQAGRIADNYPGSIVRPAGAAPATGKTL